MKSRVLQNKREEIGQNLTNFLAKKVHVYDAAQSQNEQFLGITYPTNEEYIFDYVKENPTINKKKLLNQKRENDIANLFLIDPIDDEFDLLLGLLSFLSAKQINVVPNSKNVDQNNLINPYPVINKYILSDPKTRIWSENCPEEFQKYISDVFDEAKLANIAYYLKYPMESGIIAYGTIAFDTRQPLLMGMLHFVGEAHSFFKFDLNAMFNVNAFHYFDSADELIKNFELLKTIIELLLEEFGNS